MRTTLAAAAISLVVALVVMANIPTKLLYPDQCADSSDIGQFCAQYDPTVGSYEPPPPMIPADFEFRPDEARASSIRMAVGAGAFALALVAAWAWIRLARRRTADGGSRDIRRR